MAPAQIGGIGLHAMGRETEEKASFATNIGLEKVTLRGAWGEVPRARGIALRVQQPDFVRQTTSLVGALYARASVFDVHSSAVSSESLAFPLPCDSLA